MLLSEMVRKLAHEQTIIADTAIYESDTAAHDWTDKVTNSFTLPVKSLVYVKFTVETTDAVNGAGRLVIDGKPAVSSGGLGALSSRIREFFVELDAGDHTFAWQTSIWYAGGGKVRIKDRYVYAYEFADTKSASFDSGEVTIANYSTKTFYTATISGLPRRKLACGTVKNYRLELVFFMLNTTIRKDKVVYAYNISGGYVNWKLLINGSFVYWTEQNDDYTSDTSNPAYGIGAYGKYRMLAPAGKDITFAVQVYNASGSDKVCRVYVLMFASPWIIPPGSYEPFTLSFPQGSTLYVTLEPLLSDPTKTVKIGKTRAPSFGDSTDYYYINSGTGILNCSYTFEIVEVANCVLVVEGYGACISMVGVDVR